MTARGKVGRMKKQESKEKSVLLDRLKLAEFGDDRQAAAAQANGQKHGTDTDMQNTITLVRPHFS